MRLSRAAAASVVALVSSALPACSSASGQDTLFAHPDGQVSDGSPAAPDARPRTPRPVDAGMDGRASNDASTLPDTSSPVDARAGMDATLHDAQPRDATPSDAVSRGPREAAPPDGPEEPDCTCPPLDFFLDANVGGAALHLTAPYPLGIYCPETAVQIAHPACGEVYRLSACGGPGSAPPCFYMGVDRSRGLLLGNYIDADRNDFDVIEGAITPDPPMGRVGNGSFMAVIRPRGGGDTTSVSGTFHACVTRMPACQS